MTRVLAPTSLFRFHRVWKNGAERVVQGGSRDVISEVHELRALAPASLDQRSSAMSSGMAG
jgi:hypothetical protein